MALRNKRWISWTILFLAIVISFVTKFISLSMYEVPPGADYGNYLSQVNILHGYDLRGLGLRYDPLYFILLDGFLRIFDPFTALKVAASLVFSIIAIPFFLFVRKLSNSFTASIGAWFLVFFEGYSEMIAWGGNPNFLGFSLMLLTFFSLIKTLEKPSKKNVILTGFFLSLIIGTHILVTIFTLFSFLIFIILTYIFKRKTDTWCLLKIILSSSLIAIVFSLPYFPVYMTFLRNCSNGLIRFNVHQLITMTGSLAWLFRTQYLIITIMIMLSGFALVKYYKENSRNNALILTSLFLSPLILALTTENADRWLYFLPIPIIVCFCLYLKNLFTYIKGMKKEVLLFTFCCMLLICAEWSINSLNRLKTAVDFYQIIYKDESQALSWIKDNTPPNATFITSGPSKFEGVGNTYAWWIEGYSERKCIWAGFQEWGIYQYERNEAQIASRIFAGNYSFEYGNIRVSESFPSGIGNPGIAVGIHDDYQNVILLRDDKQKITVLLENGSISEVEPFYAKKRTSKLCYNQTLANTTITYQFPYLKIIRNVIVGQEKSSVDIFFQATPINSTLREMQINLWASNYTILEKYYVEHSLITMYQRTMLGEVVTTSIKIFPTANVKVENATIIPPGKRKKIPIAASFLVKPLRNLNKKICVHLRVSVVTSFAEKNPTLHFYSSYELLKNLGINYIFLNKGRAVEYQRFLNDPHFTIVFPDKKNTTSTVIIFKVNLGY